MSASRKLRVGVSLTVVAGLCVVGLLLLRIWTKPTPSVPPDAKGVIETFLGRSAGGRGESESSASYVLADAKPDGAIVFAVEWVSRDIPITPLSLQFRQVDKDTDGMPVVVSAELSRDEVAVRELPAGLFVIEDIDHRVLFAAHAVHSDGEGRAILGVRGWFGSAALPCAAAARVDIRVVSDLKVAETESPVRVAWLSSRTLDGGCVWEGELEVPLSSDETAILVLPRLETRFVVDADSGYAFESGFSYAPGVPRDGDVIELRLLRCGYLLARVRERQPGDFVRELDRQLAGWFEGDGRYPLTVSISPSSHADGIEPADGATPGGAIEILCDRARIDRIGLGMEELRIPFILPGKAREVQVTVSCVSGVVASGYVTILPGNVELPAWLEASSSTWLVQVVAEDADGTPLDGVCIVLQPSIWKSRGKEAQFLGPDREQTTSDGGIANFEHLPMMPGAFVVLRITSGHKVLDAPQTITPPTDSARTLVRVRVANHDSDTMVRVQLAVPAHNESPGEWLAGDIQYAILCEERGGARRTWDGSARLDADRGFLIDDAPVGDYSVVLIGSFGVAAAHGEVAGGARVLSVPLAPRELRAIVMRNDKPLAGAIVFPLRLDPALVWSIGSRGRHAVVSLGQCVTDSSGEFRLLFSGDASFASWGFYHQDIGVFRVAAAKPAPEGKLVLTFEERAASGNLVIAFDPTDRPEEIPSTVHITPVISEAGQRTTMDFAWGIALAVAGSEVAIHGVPAGRYVVLVTGKSQKGDEKVTVAPQWKRFVTVDEEKITRVTFPSTD